LPDSAFPKSVLLAFMLYALLSCVPEQAASATIAAAAKITLVFML